MPVYEYQGQHYDLPDGLSNEDAIGKIKKHLGVEQPKKTLEMTAKENPVVGGLEAGMAMMAGLPSQIAGGVGGLSAGIYHGLKEGSASAGVDAGTQVAEEIQKNNFGMGDYKPSTKTGQYYTDKLQNAMSLPGELAGKGAEALGLDPIYGKLPVDAAMNFLPLGVPAGAGRFMTRERPLAKPTGDPIAALREQAAQRLPEQMELPLQNSPQQVAEMRGATMGQRDMFGPVNEELGRPDMGQPIGPKPVAPPIDAMRQHELFDQPEQGRVANPYEAVTGDWRIDENGMPIKADLSMDVANAENPLQRNLWGDELPQKHPQEAPRSLTEAIDSMGWAEKRGAINRQLRGDLDASPHMEAAKMELEGMKIPKGQRGAMDISWLDPIAQKVKEIADGVQLIMKGGEAGPSVHAMKNGKEIGRLDLGTTDWVNPTKNSSLTPNWVGVNSEFQRRNIATEMYKMVRENGNDIVPSKNQTADGKALNKSFSKDYTEIWKDSQVPGDFPVQRGPFNVPKGQRGSAPIINDLAKIVEDGIKRLKGQSASRTLGTLPMGDGKVGHDSIATPRLPATIEAKDQTRQKLAASALKDVAPEYASITTPEEAIHLAANAKDINKNPVRDQVISGINAQVMNAKNNPVLNFTRYALQTARNAATKFSKDFVTSKDGVATTYSKLKGNDRVQAIEILREAAVAKLEITPENIKKLGLKPEQEAYILSVRRAMDEQWSLAADSLQMAGRDVFEKRAGYLPNLFTGSYKSLIGTMKNGVFTTLEIAQADTRHGHNAAVKAALDANPGAVVREMPRTGLKTMGTTNSLFNGFNNIMNVIAKHDPRFAELQMNAQMKVNEANHRLMNFDVHEMHKKGIKGSVGDIRTLSREANANQLGKALIDFLEQGATYYTEQKALNDIGKVLTSPEVAHMPNTTAVVAQHLQHVTGNNLNPVGAVLNWGVDGLFKAVGLSPNIPADAARGLKTAAGIHMMGLWNPTFTALQLTQVVTGAIPQALKVGGKLEIQANRSAVVAPSMLSVLKTAKAFGKEVPAYIPDHMKAAFQYAQDHGIMDFSELEIAHTATRNKGINMAEKVGSLPISIGEKMTRPPVFMTFADMFHNFGLSDADAFMAAQHATNMAMGDYHPAERPKIYAGLGIVGEFGGALTTFKHNALTNMYLQGRDALIPDGKGKRLIAPALVATASAALFQGIAGMPGFEELDSAYQWATGMMGNSQGITETALKDAPEWGKYGYLSATSGIDFQSRLSMANALPDASFASLSPQLSVVGDIGLKAYNYGKYGDEQSYQEFVRAVTPSGLKGLTEDTLMTDKEGFVSNPAGELMNEQPRTDKERLIRKVFAVKPLRESVESKDVYIDAKNVKTKEEAQNVLTRRFRQALARGDQDGMDKLAQAYYDKEGDPQTLWNDAAVQSQIVRSNQSQRQRMTGQLEATMKSINRYRDMNDGK